MDRSDMNYQETLARFEETAHSVARKKRLTIIGVGGVLLLVFIPLLISLVAVLNTADYLKECTTPSTNPKEPHVCYENGQERTARALQTLICVLSIPPDERSDKKNAECGLVLEKPVQPGIPNGGG